MSALYAVILPAEQHFATDTDTFAAAWLMQFQKLGVSRLYTPGLAEASPPAWLGAIASNLQVTSFDEKWPAMEAPFLIIKADASPYYELEGLPPWHQACRAGMTLALVRDLTPARSTAWTIGSRGAMTPDVGGRAARFQPLGVYYCSSTVWPRLWEAWQRSRRIELVPGIDHAGLPVPTTGKRTFKPGKGWTLFLDRDGVINERIIGGYVRTPDEFRLLPGVPEALQRLRRQFDRIVVVTNQQGIGKSLMTADDLGRVHEKLLAELGSFGVNIDGIYACPGLAGDNPPCRKPLPGMAIQALADHPAIDFERSVMVGDSESDIEFGRRLGMFTLKVGDQSHQADLCLGSLAEWS